MDRSRYLASVIGPFLLAMGVAVVLNRDELPGMVQELTDDRIIVLFAGAVIFIAGLALVRSHPVWRGWPSVLTLIGCAGVLGGLARMLFPTLLIREAQATLHWPFLLPLAALLVGALGLFLTWQGYRPRPPETPR